MLGFIRQHSDRVRLVMPIYAGTWIPSGCHNDTFSKGASACLARMLGFIRLHSDRVRPVMPKLDIGMMGLEYHPGVITILLARVLLLVWRGC